VLIPVLDSEKHYWVGEDEIDKLFQHGKGGLLTILKRTDNRQVLNKKKTACQPGIKKAAGSQ